MNFLKQSAGARYVIILLIIGWALCTIFFYGSGWKFNVFNVLSGMCMIFATFRSGMAIGQDYGSWLNKQ